jgi:transposase
MSQRKPYPSDLSDERWALIEPVITAWKAAHPSVSGHRGAYEMREIINAIPCQGRTGCQWDFLPHDLPPRSAVYYYFALWRVRGRVHLPHQGPPPDRPGWMRHPGAHHSRGLRHIDRRDPLQDLLVLLVLDLLRLQHPRPPPGHRKLTMASGTRGVSAEETNLTGVLVATMRNP